MKISKININNIASFSKFSTDAETIEKNVIFLEQTGRVKQQSHHYYN